MAELEMGSSTWFNRSRRPYRTIIVLVGKSPAFWSSIDWLFASGNHEQDLLDTFHGFKERFVMPMVNENENMYYSVDVGPIHFIAFSTEHYFSLEDPFVGIQYEWFVNDLIQGNTNLITWFAFFDLRLNLTFNKK